ncbi:MAG TPA: CvpA family protein [Pyrinomonadaceae bacterium]|jgi:membrane protein required for colicin V production
MMTVFDLIVLALVGSSLVAGALRGLVRALIATGALLVGVFVAARGYEVLGAWLRGAGLVASEAAAQAWGFLLIVGVVLALGFAAGQMVRGHLKRARLEWLDRSLGALFGLARGLAVCSVMYLALTAFPVRLSAVTEARSAPVLAASAEALSYLTSTELRARFLAGYRRVSRQ